MATHLRYCLMGATLDCNENRHAQVVMKELGITYEEAIPQSLGDQWWFMNCKNIPEKLPDFLSIMDNVEMAWCIKHYFGSVKYEEWKS